MNELRKVLQDQYKNQLYFYVSATKKLKIGIKKAIWLTIAFKIMKNWY